MKHIKPKFKIGDIVDAENYVDVMVVESVDNKSLSADGYEYILSSLNYLMGKRKVNTGEIHLEKELKLYDMNKLDTEQRIYIAAGHDTEKIKMIRELIEEEGERVIKFFIKKGLDVSNEPMVNFRILYQETKQTK